MCISFTKVVEKQDDYSNITIPGLNDVQITVDEIQTKPFTDILSSVLIVDVPDGAVLNKNHECSATFRLAPKE